MATIKIPHKSRKKPTKLEKTQRIADCYTFLSQGFRPNDVCHAIAKRYGCDWTTVRDVYLPRARELMIADASRPKAEHQAESYRFYAEVVANAQAKNADRIKARERIDKLLGLEAPAKHALTDTEGNNIIVYLPKKDPLPQIEESGGNGQVEHDV